MKKRLPKGYYFDKRKGLYKLSFTVDGIRHSVWGQTLKECEEKKEKKLDALKNHLHLDNQKITLEKYYCLWSAEQAKEVKASTLYNYEKSWKYLDKHLGKRQISALTKIDVLQMQQNMKKNCSEDTINRATRLLKQILNSAMNDRIINYNPCSSIKKLKSDKPKAVDTNHRALTKEETDLFFLHAKDSHYFNLFRFLICTGCRIGEATALTWFDINFSKKEININKTVSRVSNAEFALSRSPKTSNSTRTIPITEELEQILLLQKENNALLFGTKNQIVFPNSKGTMANYNSVNICIANIIKNINEENTFFFAPFSVHGFRDTFATRCIEQGMNPQTLKALMGHSSLKMTMDLYAHVMPNTKHEELCRISFAV